RGVFRCDRPVPDDTPMPPAQKELSERDWIELLYLAHKDKPAAFQRYAGHDLATNGQLYWSDEQQMSIYPENYHRVLDKRLQSEFRGTEGITEIYCERDALPAFMAEVARNARREKMEIIYGTVRLIEQDKESFLAWARKPYACVVFNLHIEHTSRGLIRATATWCPRGRRNCAREPRREPGRRTAAGRARRRVPARRALGARHRGAADVSHRRADRRALRGDRGAAARARHARLHRDGAR